MKDTLNYTEFKGLTSIKHNADLDCGDIIYLSCGTNFHGEDNQYHRTTCDSRCGKDEFAGERFDGRRVAWCDMDWFKIVGKEISI